MQSQTCNSVKILGMKTIMLSNDHSKLSEELKSLVDLKLPDLATFASLLVNTQNLSLWHI